MKKRKKTPHAMHAPSCHNKHEPPTPETQQNTIFFVCPESGPVEKKSHTYIDRNSVKQEYINKKEKKEIGYEALW